MTGKKFERTTPEAVGISSKSLEQLIENLERVTEMHGIMLMRHEKYVQRGGGRLMRQGFGIVSIL